MNLSNESIKVNSTMKKDQDVADIFRFHSHKLASISLQQQKVIQAIVDCRTAEMGGHALKCEACDHIEMSYNSCRNRHCPKCQSLAKVRWIEKRKDDLLPVQYFHIVFTLSNLLFPIALFNKRVVYNILFKAVSETLKEVAANPENLGAEIGFVAALHTWNQKLDHHPHIHCIVPGGGLTEDRNNWINCPSDFFVHVRILSIVFRAKFLDYLEKAFLAKELSFSGKIAYLSEYKEFKDILKQSCKSNWVVYAKKPFAGPEQVFQYLGRYTHKIAISNNRILSLTENRVTFNWRDRRGNDAVKTMSLDVELFMKRFLLHVLPERFVRIRHYGILGNPNRKKIMALCRRLLDVVKTCCEEKVIPASWQELMMLLTGKDPTICPECGKGRLCLYMNIKSSRRIYRVRYG